MVQRQPSQVSKETVERTLRFFGAEAMQYDPDVSAVRAAMSDDFFALRRVRRSVVKATSNEVKHLAIVECVHV